MNRYLSLGKKSSFVFNTKVGQDLAGEGLRSFEWLCYGKFRTQEKEKRDQSSVLLLLHFLINVTNTHIFSRQYHSSDHKYNFLFVFIFVFFVFSVNLSNPSLDLFLLLVFQCGRSRGLSVCRLFKREKHSLIPLTTLSQKEFQLNRTSNHGCLRSLGYPQTCLKSKSQHL